ALDCNPDSMITRAAARADAVDAKNFRVAAIRLNQRLTIQPTEPQPVRFDIANAHPKLVDAMRATAVFPQLVARQVRFTFNPDWLLNPEHLIPAMAYPDFPDPMYERLRDISSELFLPNLELVPPNTISLLVTNPEFIDAYMTGLNHEFGRELLWREYPTDQRGSYFRQFWDVKGIIADDSDLTPEKHAEILFPMFRAEVEPDIRFFGFDMKPEDAKGADNPQTATDDWGYYFIIQQVPGEPRFGMDIEFEPDDPNKVTWDDLSWDEFS